MQFIYSPSVILVGRTEFVRPPEFVTPGWEPEGDLFDGQAIVEFGGRACYRSWKNPAGRTNEQYIANILDHKHFSVTEHTVYSLWIEGISRSCSHEVVRHRHGSPSQESQRYVPARDINFVMPVAYIGDSEMEALYKADAAVSLGIYNRHLERMEAKFASVEDVTLRRKMARESAREMLPNGAETRLLMTMNVRAWREFVEKRANEHADAQICRLAVQCFRVLEPHAPALWQDMAVGRGDKTGRAVIVPLGPLVTP